MEGKLSYLPLSSVHGSIGQYKKQKTNKKKTAVVIESEEEETKFQKRMRENGERVKLLIDSRLFEVKNRQHPFMHPCLWELIWLPCFRKESAFT